MKIAICGMGPAGLEASLHFHQLGAEIKIFEAHTFGANLLAYPQDSLMDGTWGEITSEFGRSLTQKENLDTTPTVGNYLNQYFFPLVQKLNLAQFTQKALVKRVHKRFLQIDQEIPGTTRLRDLFRVVYVSEIKIDEESKDYYNELVTRLGAEVVNSLKESIEHYEDFDLVIDSTGPYAKPRLAGPSGTYAIGEERLKNSHQLIYGLPQALTKIKNLKEESEIALYGTTVESALALIQLEDWIFSGGHHLRLLSIETNPFEALSISKSAYEKTIGERARKILKRNSDEFALDIAKFEQKVEDWKNLDDFVRVKYPKPAEPLKRIEVIVGGVITALDKLIDQERLYLTVEFPEFLTNNASTDLMTLAQDLLLVLNGHHKSSTLAHGLRLNPQGPTHTEPGFYSLDGHQKKVLSDLTIIETDLMKYFSRT